MNKQQDSIGAKAHDFARKVQRSPYETFFSRFLSPGEQRAFTDALSETYPSVARRTFLWGGASGAERRCALFVPEYVDVDASPLSKPLSPEREAFLNSDVLPFLDSEETTVKAVKITGSPYTPLSHRDYLGSILALGISRDVIGDIAVVGEYTAVVFALDSITPYILTSLERIGRDKVKTELFTPDESFVIPREYESLTVPVASPRLDCLVASLTNLSREKAKELCLAGMVELSYKAVESPDEKFSEGDTLSIRGYGKFIVDSFGGVTRSGRTRVAVRKYI